jgi:AcrR family transcriptional regulator
MADLTRRPAAGPPETAARPLRRDAERNRQRIIVAAREVFAERGLAATLDDVAARAGVGVGTVYRRFPDKETLLSATFADLFDRLAVLAEEALTRDGGWEGLAHFLRQCGDLLAGDRGLRDLALASGYGTEELSALRGRLSPLVERLVARAQAEGTLRADVRETDVRVLLFMLSEVAYHGGGVRPGLHARYLQIFLDGLRAPGTGDLGAPLSHEDLDTFGRSLAPHRG